MNEKENEQAAAAAPEESSGEGAIAVGDVISGGEAISGEADAACACEQARESTGDDAGNDALPGSLPGEEGLAVDEPENALPPLSLEALPPALRAACARAGWETLMPVQSRALPYMLEGRDIMVQSRTGSGKTGAYLLPLLARLNPEAHAVQALVLTPTRELAVQVEREAHTLLEGSGLSVAAVYGGVGYGRQMEALRNGVSVVVGTPGRILDHLLRRTLTLDGLRELIFDEADRMLSIGFYPDMKEIQRYLPRRPIHATLFSATYPPHVLQLAGDFLRDPQLLSLSARQVYVAEVAHLYAECDRMDKDRALLRILEVENPASAIVFCNTRSDVHYIAAVLQGFGFNADELSADLSQKQREEVLDRLRRGEIRFLVATDVAARGIDIPALSHVILYSPPEDRESYIHRAGRTGRAGAAGVVISLVDVMEKLEMQRIAAFYRLSLTRLPVPTDEEAARAVGLRVAALLEARARRLSGLERERLRRFDAFVRESAADPESLLSLLVDDFYQQHVNPSLPPVGEAGAREKRSGESRREKRPGESGESRSSRRRRRSAAAAGEAREGRAEAGEAPAEEKPGPAEEKRPSEPGEEKPGPIEMKPGEMFGPAGGEEASQEAEKPRRRRRSRRRKSAE